MKTRGRSASCNKSARPLKPSVTLHRLSVGLVVFRFSRAVERSQSVVCCLSLGCCRWWPFIDEFTSCRFLWVASRDHVAIQTAISAIVTAKRRWQIRHHVMVSLHFCTNHWTQCFLETKSCRQTLALRAHAFKFISQKSTKVPLLGTATTYHRIYVKRW